jgi:putative transcriptional regulator
MTNIAPIKNRIKAYRQSKYILQQQMADDLGIERTYLSKIENQTFTPGPKLIRDICIYLNATLDELFYL